MLEQDFEHSVGYWSYLVARSFERALNEELAPHGITYRQFQVLGWLAIEKELTQAHLAERMGVEPPTLVGILDRMERDGWIVREVDRSDRRKKLIRPTPRVKPVWDKIRACIQRVRGRALHGVDAKELALVIRVLTQVQQNLLPAAVLDQAV